MVSTFARISKAQPNTLVKRIKEIIKVKLPPYSKRWKVLALGDGGLVFQFTGI
jgi:hypothetical protein